MSVPEAGPRTSLAHQVRSGLVWGMVGGLVLRSGSFIIGIALARILAPQAFGVYAVGLTVQGLLLTFADLGLVADLVRSPDFRRRAPTITTLSLLTGGLLTALMAAGSGTIASAMGTPDAATVVLVMSFSLVVTGAGVAPKAELLRTFSQKKLFATNGVEFAVTTVLTIGLVLAGWGPVALAVARLAGQSSSTLLTFVVSRTPFRVGLDREVVRSALGFGVPVAAVNLVAVLMLSVDNIVIARVAGDVALGFYVLALNISNWPNTIMGNAITSVSLPAFARTDPAGLPRSLHRSTALTTSGALLIGVCLAATAGPLVAFLYGPRWSASATVLAVLALGGALRVVVDLSSSFLLSQGLSRPVMWLNLGSLAVLVPAMVAATRWQGIVGCAGARLAVVLLVTIPAMTLTLGLVPGARRALLSAAWRPLLAAVPAGAVGYLASQALGQPVLALLAGGLASIAVMAALLLRWLRPQVSTGPDGAGVPAPAALEPAH